jgi:predicted nucleic acid-binding protein
LGLIGDLDGGPVGLDTAIFIYFIEEHPRFLPLVESIFLALDQGRLIGMTSAVTLLETLVVPMRAGNLPLAERYESILSNSRGLRLIDIDRPLVRLAAQIRALEGLKTPDDLQIAAALRSGCTTFLTNDRKIPAVGGLQILQLHDSL